MLIKQKDTIIYLNLYGIRAKKKGTMICIIKCMIQWRSQDFSLRGGIKKIIIENLKLLIDINNKIRNKNNCHTKSTKI